MKKSEYLTPNQVSELTGWRPNHVRKLIRTGKLPAADVSTGNDRPRYRILRSDVERILTPTVYGERQ